MGIAQLYQVLTLDFEVNPDFQERVYVQLNLCQTIPL